MVVLAGSVRRCPADQSEHYPRTDSAIIVLVKDEADRILLGRQKFGQRIDFQPLLDLLNQVNHLKIASQER